MLYGDEKLRQIGKSPLPATRNKARSTRKDLANIKRRGRRSTRQTLHCLAVDSDFDEFEGFVNEYPATEIRYAMYDRRDADNLGALFAWARKKIATDFKSMTDEERYFAFKNVLPDTMQGRHALDHIDIALLDRNPHERLWLGRYMTDAERASARQSAADKLRNHLRSQLTKILDEQGHAWLNWQLGYLFDKTHLGRGCKYDANIGFVRCDDCRRMYLGADDMDDFIEFLCRQETGRGRNHHDAFKLVDEYS